MKYSTDHIEYTLLDCSGGERLEDWNGIILIRPDPQVIWSTPKTDPRWEVAHARYRRSKSGGGGWEVYKKIPESWRMRYKELVFNLKPMGFKHTGVFPEQAVNWDWLMANVKQGARILNLFAYTGAATLACLKAGAEVTHVDASKGMVAWAKENAAASGLADAKCRWMVDDCIKFVEREGRRDSKYEGIIMDPPSYGRGPGGEVWQLEEKLYPLVVSAAELLSPEASFFMINSYTAGLAPSCAGYLAGSVLKPLLGGTVDCYELGLPVKSSGMTLPCGSTALWRR